MTDQKQDLYALLGVKKSDDAEVIRKAFRELAKKYHPDKNPDNPEAEEKFKEINSAYEVLSDPQKRSQYDQFGTTEPRMSSAHDADFQNIQDLMNGFMRNRQENEPVVVDIEISIEASLKPSTHHLKYQHIVGCGACEGNGGKGKKDTCSSCNGTGHRTYRQRQGGMEFLQFGKCQTCSGRGVAFSDVCSECYGLGRISKTSEVTVEVEPHHIGRMITKPGLGHRLNPNAPAGALILRVLIKNHAFFGVDDQLNVHSDVIVDPVEAMLGKEKQVKTPDGTEIKLILPEGCRPEQILRVAGKGLVQDSSGRRADMLVHVKFVLPRKLTDAQKANLEAYLAGIKT